MVQDSHRSPFCSVRLDKTHFFVHAAHPLAHRERITPHDLEGVPVHVPGKGFESYEALRVACEREGVTLGPLTHCAVGYGMYEYVSQNMA